jgi:rhamnosyltransferase
VSTPDLVSVVIPTKDGAETLLPLLDALRMQKAVFEIEVIAVDSGSRDGSLEILSNRDLTLIQIPPHEFSHGKTRNLGIARSRGEFVVLLTQDAIPQGDDFLENLVRPFGDSQVAGVYGRQVPRDDCDVITRRGLENWVTGRAEPAVSRLAAGEFQELSPYERYSACVFDNVCSALRRSVWERQPFAAAEWGEDIIWGKEAILAGWSIAYEPRAAVIHSHRRSIGYEYSRTRICHQTLYTHFGLENVPRLENALRGLFDNLRHDLAYVLREAPSRRERLLQVFRAAGLAFAGPLAQWQGVRDARRAQALLPEPGVGSSEPEKPR